MVDRLALTPSSLVLASPNRGGWPLPLQRFEASTVGSLALRLGPSRRRGFVTADCSPAPPVTLHVSSAFHMVTTLQITRPGETS